MRRLSLGETARGQDGATPTCLRKLSKCTPVENLCEISALEGKMIQINTPRSKKGCICLRLKKWFQNIPAPKISGVYLSKRERHRS